MGAIVNREADSIIESVIVKGDLSGLSPRERANYYGRVCESVGLNPLTKPFEYLRLNGREMLYATRTCTDQLRQLHGVSIRITQRENVGDVYVVTASATDKNGRVDESTGAVVIGSLKGENLANALMKAETKAKRRVTLSICGLGMLDESELDTVPKAAIEAAHHPEAAALVAEVRDVTTQASEAQARHKNESEALADQWGPMIEDLASSDEIARWCNYHGFAWNRLHTNARTRIYRAIGKKCTEHKVTKAELDALLRKAPDHGDENDGEEQ